MQETLSLPKLIGREDIAAWAGISVRTLEKWIREGRFPRPARIGGQKRWRHEVVEAYIERQEAAAAEAAARPRQRPQTASAKGGTDAA